MEETYVGQFGWRKVKRRKHPIDVLMPPNHYKDMIQKDLDIKTLKVIKLFRKIQ